MLAAQVTAWVFTAAAMGRWSVGAAGQRQRRLDRNWRSYQMSYRYNCERYFGLKSLKLGMYVEEIKEKVEVFCLTSSSLPLMSSTHTCCSALVKTRTSFCTTWRQLRSTGNVTGCQGSWRYLKAAQQPKSLWVFCFKLTVSIKSQIINHTVESLFYTCLA